MRTPASRIGLAIIAAVIVVLGLNRTVVAASPTTKISVTPAAVTINTDQTQAFTVTATAADNSTTDVTSASNLSINDPNGSLTNATYTPGKSGTWTVQATYQSFTASAVVTVTPGAVKEVVVNPNSEPEQTYLGTNVKFTATAYDGKNNIVSGQTFGWSVIGDIGTIDANGVFTPKKIGSGKVQASTAGVDGQVSVVTNAALTTNTANTNTTNTNTAVRNTNAATNGNANGNANANANTNTSTASTTTDVATKDCTTLKPWVWTLILVLFLVAVAALYMFMPIAKIWPPIAALVLAAGLAYVQRTYGCAGQMWWAWVITIGTVAITAFALQMRPKSMPSGT